MTRPKPNEIEEQLKKQELDEDGSQALGGSASVAGDGSTADTEEMVKEVYGNRPNDPDGFDAAREIDKDENDIAHKPGSYEEEEDSEEIKEKEDVSEDTAGDDPYEKLGEDDDLDEPSNE